MLLPSVTVQLGGASKLRHMPKPNLSPAKILVVEDNQADVFLLRHALNEHAEEYELEVLRDGAEAILFVQQQRTDPSDPTPCAIVLDLHLPMHDGAAVLKAIRMEPVLAHIHVVALTSFASPREETEVKSLGINLYRAKPTDLDGWIELAGAILELCRNAATVSA
jgi:chemotaxis family two-component system response regulator Rcp1